MRNNEISDSAGYAIKIQTDGTKYDKGGNIVIMRVNFLHKPFSEQKARQALLYLINRHPLMH